VVCPLCRCDVAGIEPARDGLCSCTSCDWQAPVLQGIVFAFADPAGYAADHRDSILASLAEHGALTQRAVELVVDFAGRVPHSDRRPALYEDDWTEAEVSGRERSLPESPAAQELVSWLSRHERESPRAFIESHLPVSAQSALEIGPGAGELTGVLAARCSSVLVVDRSLRALLGARARAGQPIQAVLGDASALELEGPGAEIVVCANVIDLVDEPAALAERLAEWTAASGRLLLTTPRPDLASGEDGAVGALLEEAGFQLDEVRDGLPWLRWHSQRNQQLYWAWGAAASHC
jgi:SAM-dependent methyltransferase